MMSKMFASLELQDDDEIEASRDLFVFFQKFLNAI